MDNNNNFNQNFQNQAPVEPAAPQNYVPQQEAPVAQPVQAEPIYNGVPQGNVPPMPAQSAKKDSNGLAIGSLVTGILSVTCCCGNFVGIALSIAAIVLGIVSKKQQSENNTMAVIGIILGAVGIVLFIVSLVLGFGAGILAGVAESMNSSSYSYYY